MTDTDDQLASIMRDAILRMANKTDAKKPQILATTLQVVLLEMFSEAPSYEHADAYVKEVVRLVKEHLDEREVH